MDDAGANEWLPIQQAAKRLGVSADTIRRRLKRGELASRRDDTPQGYRWLIRMDAPSSPPNAPGSPRTRETPVQGSAPALVDDGREALIATLREELASRVREVAELHSVILAQAKALESRAAALPATVEAAASAPPSPDAIAQAETSPAQSSIQRRRSLWEWVRGR